MYVPAFQTEHRWSFQGTNGKINQQATDDQFHLGPAEQECRQYKILVKDSQENRQEDWVQRCMDCKDDSSSSESSSDPKKKKKKAGLCGKIFWGWTVVCNYTHEKTVLHFAPSFLLSQHLISLDLTHSNPVAMPSTNTQEMLERLHLASYEKLCVSCWAGVLIPYLDQWLGLKLSVLSQELWRVPICPNGHIRISI